MSKIDRSELRLALNEENELFTAGYHNGMAHGIMINPEFYNDPLAWTTPEGTYVKACGGFFTTTNSKGQDTPVERKYSDTTTCKNCTKLMDIMGEAARQAKWDNSYEKIEALGELAAAQREVEEAEKAIDATVALIFAPDCTCKGADECDHDQDCMDCGCPRTVPVITLPTMLSVAPEEYREESPAQADGPSVEVVKVEAKPVEGAVLPGHTTNTPQDSKTPAPRKISKPKVHKPLTEPKLFDEASGAVHTEDRQNPAADDFAGGAQAGTYRGHTSLTSGRDMTGAMPRERAEGGKPVRTTMDMPLGRERLDISARTDKAIVSTGDGVKIVTDRVGGKFGFLNGAEYHKLSRSAQRRYWVKVKRARNAAAEKANRDSQGK